jgi:hypothetical protein
MFTSDKDFFCLMCNLEYLHKTTSSDWRENKFPGRELLLLVTLPWTPDGRTNGREKRVNSPSLVTL